MPLPISELALVEPLPHEPFMKFVEDDGTITQAIYTYGPNQHTRRRWFPWENKGKGGKKVMPYSRAMKTPSGIPLLETTTGACLHQSRSKASKTRCCLRSRAKNALDFLQRLGSRASLNRGANTPNR